ncbi:methionyl-tRNA formyltransferase [Albimonas sp. CAU 1670]|uniref:methionyl-tRNA formyltransferase n=1 Tax=Albimonas sp. CAU 1670 TaxID=3032599 RepID=UPI0023DC71DD|nr:methionyl-tRNA formyltransferase [Albimonas sp. CAU 1670]MDF2233421.1 methionyl-tRNA formyltransferase [Albimonas sp. CAU 1670]
MRLVFMGTPDFSVPILRALHAAGHEIAAVYSQPPRPAGRGKKPRPSPVQAAAEALGIEVRTPVSLKDPEAQAAFAALGAEAAVVVAYGLILPRAVLDAPRLGCWNLHASLLPRWRGAAPIQRAIMAGDAETGVGVMRMEPGLDTGPVLAEARTAIGAQDTAQTLHDRLSALAAGLIVETLPRIAAGEAPTPQPEDGVVYAAKIDKAEARIDWTRPADELDRLVRGLSPFPGAWCEIEGERVKILLSRPEAGSDQAEPGEALDDGLLIACGAGALRLLRLQRPGRGPMEAQELLRGFAVPKGARLG